MAVHDDGAGAAPAPARRNSIIYDPKARGLFFQTLVVLGVGFFLYEAASNAIANLQRQNIASGFGFLDETAGFEISQTLIAYSPTSTYGRAFVVGLLNTLLVAVVGIALATVVGFIVGVMRLSKNWLIRQIATAYVEVIRNVPLLLQLFFWYFAVLKQLPGPRQSIPLGFGTSLNIRGLYIPAPVLGPGSGLVIAAFVVAVVGIVVLARWAKRRQMATGERFPVLPVSVALFVGLPLLAYFVAGRPITFEIPELQGFNLQGGVQIIPEFVALLLGLAMYTAAFIAEIVRAGILAVSKGQTEAAHALGIKPGTTLWLVIIPQAMRVIIPPLTSQYLNLTKNSSLAVAIGYPDLVSVFAGTVLNQTGQAVEVISLTMLVYLVISLLTSAFMNWFNAHVALVER
ncbi:amino acid ABC transporter permease [Amorphus orientalis]|uniref:General L-amino acid transport system permease protein n=1 Tax=Amorphus orientalis TaxID=649198 RepID=A0AAE3VQY2_9HYPH|nr:amino acid ABC transporter permease [Amorphus orientalis]MDQ0316338.1 general L-amino acid transport system permease protein [Amorphus orientalis]